MTSRRDRAVEEAITRVRLAIAEVRVIERKRDQVVLERRIANRNALARAYVVFTHAVSLVARARLDDGTATGQKPLTKERRWIVRAEAELRELLHELHALEQLT
jgi:hypothetical protein